ncbi:fructosamine kinase family protein [Fictibacillus enclensis]|uniref:fructosamine kinase family protein n=1 Tax=Fictibacillus enclensis TaxID=1017270 RepID=UPI0025A264FA|nr:fructosamine kinase family protein [Fictibacillus enclensis]MDM5199132.1 fructosamine kinase family protein [Fictibacillus enclensis]
MCDSKGEPVLIDPAILYGHSEMELAFTERFGGFSPSFYEAYTYYRPLGQDHEDRKELYQLFYLIVQLNLFGEGYGSSVGRVLFRFQS